VRHRRAQVATAGTAAGGPVIELAGVEKTYRSGRVGLRALRGVDLVVAAGEMVAITGPSGSGKTTIVNLIAGIDRPTAGTVMVNGSRLDQMTEEKLAAWRGHNWSCPAASSSVSRSPARWRANPRSCSATSPPGTSTLTRPGRCSGC
jgi:ABC-type oligopeptide transport system ATPase subunit